MVGGPELGIMAVLLVLSIAPLGIGIFALIDIAQRPESQFVAAGQSRTTWLVIAILSFFVPCVFVAVLYYLITVRRKLPPRGSYA